MNKDVEIIKIFDYEIIKCKIPNILYNNYLLKQNIDRIFKSELILDQNYDNLTESSGNMHSTLYLSKNIIQSIPKINLLFNYLRFLILKNFYNVTNIKNFLECKQFVYNGIWMNKMYKNSSVKSHKHSNMVDGTAIFYYEVPLHGSSSYIIFDNNSEKMNSMEAKTGDVIIQSSKVIHGVTEHLSDYPRISIIMDFSIKEKIKNLKNIKYY